ncbi:Nucleolar protein 9 [Desmophyllum pertusum]|uniref:Nucleolar protein 9 n=1 Tax=Desmophyllum pertusum TaxID=174260 RepID=A0A9W9ZQH6_9CNID|nr:Nucleolar protein 9 [Desmophyllum pertusum]
MIVSRTMEKLIVYFSHAQIRQIMQNIEDHFCKIAMDKFGSHVLQTLVCVIPKAIRSERSKVREIEQEAKDLKSAEELFLNLCDCLKENLLELVNHTYGSHVVRSSFEVLGGVKVADNVVRSRASWQSRERSNQSEDKKQFIKLSQVGNAFGTNAIKPMETVAVPESFPPVLKQLTKVIIKMELQKLALHPVSNPLLQTLLLVLHKKDQFKKGKDQRTPHENQRKVTTTRLQKSKKGEEISTQPPPNFKSINFHGALSKQVARQPAWLSLSLEEKKSMTLANAPIGFLYAIARAFLRADPVPISRRNHMLNENLKGTFPKTCIVRNKAAMLWKTETLLERQAEVTYKEAITQELGPQRTTAEWQTFMARIRVCKKTAWCRAHSKRKGQGPWHETRNKKAARKRKNLLEEIFRRRREESAKACARKPSWTEDNKVVTKCLLQKSAVFGFQLPSGNMLPDGLRG